MKSITTYFLLFLSIPSLLCAMNDSNQHTKEAIQTSLHSAASAGDRQACKALIQRYLDTYHKVDIRDAEGNTPLHIAASKGHYAICLILIQHGADSSVRNFRNQIPFDVRKRGSHLSFQQDFSALLTPLGTLSDDGSSDDEETDIDDSCVTDYSASDSDEKK